MKFNDKSMLVVDDTSPSARREWIEITPTIRGASAIQVSLREEGVD